jgi:uncharacterized protein YndB with AHSA1/START domain
MQVLKRSLEIDAPPNEVWRVLTTPELVREWAAAYQDGISIRTSWREGEPVTWKAPDGATTASGRVAAFQPGKLLKFEYPAGEARSWAPEVFEIQSVDHRTRLDVTTGPLEDADFKALEGPATLAIQEIKSLAEESAQIHRAR